VKKTALIIASVFIFVNSVYAKKILKLATTTSTYETGLLDYILPPFEKKHKVKVHVISVGTGKAIKLGENADVDIIMVHARTAEDKFVADGYGINRRNLMYNDFVILGPADDPAKIFGLKNSAKALKKFFETKSIFVSRGDDFGTHKKEKLIWKKSKLNPAGKWYLEAGQGMSSTLRMADEKKAYTLVDRATYLFNKKNIRLKLLVEDDKLLLNPYGVIAVNPYKYPHVEYEYAMALIGWLTSPKCQKMIGKYRVKENLLYHPNAHVTSK
jgi:tungstate transport system substrate-binding protein